MPTREEYIAAIKAQQARLRNNIKVVPVIADRTPQRPPPPVSTASGMSRAGLQGLTAGFSDELAGLGGAAIAKTLGDPRSFSDIRQDITQSERQQMAQFAEERPVLSTATEIAGTIPTGLAGGQLLARGAQAAPQLAQMAGRAPGMLKAAGFGAAGGGVVAAGKAEQDRANEALSGALIGAVTGPVAHVILKGIGDGASRLLVRKAVSTPKKARKLVNEALKNSGYSVDEAQQIVDDLGPDAVLADLGGQLRNMARTAHSSPTGTARKSAEDFLQARDAKQHEKLWSLTRSLVGNEGRTANALDELNNAQRAAAGPLYKKAYQTSIPHTERLKEALELDSVKRAFRKGLALEENEAGRKLKEKLGKFPSMRGWDMIQRGLRREADTRFRGGDKAGAASLLKLRAGVLDDIDNVNPDFARARSVWAKGEATKEAMIQGTRFLKEDEELLEAAIESMTESEKQAFTLGVTKAIRETLDKVSVNRDLGRINLFQSPTAQRRLSMALGEDNANQILTTAKNLHEMTVTKNTILNRSPTADIMAGQNAAGLRGAAAELMRGNREGAARAMLNRNAEIQQAKVASGLGDLLLTPNPNISQMLAPAQLNVPQSIRPEPSLLGGAMGAQLINPLLGEL